jgi:alpha/beta superfamily hydrolase
MVSGMTIASADVQSCSPSEGPSPAALDWLENECERLVLLSGADHFFTGQLDTMQQALSGWLKEQLP